MTVKICFFGRLGESIGRCVEHDAAPAPVAVLRRLLAERFPGVGAALMQPSLRACVGDELVGEDHALAGVTAVDFLPPLSGG